MLLRIGFRLVVLALVASGSALVPIGLRSETSPPEPSQPPASEQKSAADKGKGHLVPPPPFLKSLPISPGCRRRWRARASG
jgi:hypothetical protein